MTPTTPTATGARSAALHALVLAGGFGRRLEPLARRLFGEAIPKQFCRFGDGRSLLQRTIDRIAPLVPPERVTVVVDRTQAPRAARQLAGFRGLRRVEQPCSRGTAAGVLLPLLDLLGRDPAATVLLTPSDHGIADPSAFLATVHAAQRAVAADPGRIVLVGAEPEAVRSDYGWIVRADRGGPVDAAERFVEKPPEEEAAALHASGRALWNTMILVAKGRRLLGLLRDRQPRLCAEMEALLAARGRGARVSVEEYERLPVADFSADVVGAADALSVVALPLEAGWTDLGTEERLQEWLRAGAGSRAQLAPTG